MRVSAECGLTGECPAAIGASNYLYHLADALGRANNEGMDYPEQNGGIGGLLIADGVAAEKRNQEDIGMISRGVRLGWGVPAEKRPTIIKRLVGLVERTSVVIATTTGPVEDEHRADSNAIRAAGVLLAMDQVDQTDHWNADKNARLDAGLATERIGAEQVIVHEALPPPT